MEKGGYGQVFIKGEKRANLKSRRLVVSPIHSLRTNTLTVAVALWLASGTVTAEIVFLKNGDVLHGSLVGVDARRITLKTPYGKLTIPKGDILRIDYEGEEKSEERATEEPKTGKSGQKPGLLPAKTSRPVVSLDIRGRSFWYAFESPPDNPVDLSLRLQLYLGEIEAAVLLDSKPDTVDNNSFYNSFTFSPTDSQITRTSEGFDCRVQEAEDGRVVLRLALPETHRSGQHMIRMIYQINEGSRSLPRWVDVTSRSFSIQVEASKETYVIVEQNAAGLEYSGFFRRAMKNVESFEVSVLSAELRDLSPEP